MRKLCLLLIVALGTAPFRGAPVDRCRQDLDRRRTYDVRLCASCKSEGKPNAAWLLTALAGCGTGTGTYSRYSASKRSGVATGRIRR